MEALVVYRPQPYSPSPAPRKARERRMAVRYPVGRKSCVSAMIVCGENSQEARAHDVSCGGIGLLLEDPLEAGTVISADLYNGAHLFHCSRLMRVAHTEQLEDG